METVLKATGLRKQYGRNPALSDLNLELPAGQVIGLLGTNGSGKTTFLKLCAGLLTPNAGQITVCGTPVGPETKLLAAFGIYYGVYTVTGTALSIISVISILFNLEQSDPQIVFNLLLCIYCAFYALLIAGGTYLSIWLMRNKLNLP